MVGCGFARGFDGVSKICGSGLFAVPFGGGTYRAYIVTAGDKLQLIGSAEGRRLKVRGLRKFRERYCHRIKIDRLPDSID